MRSNRAVPVRVTKWWEMSWSAATGGLDVQTNQSESTTNFLPSWRGGYGRVLGGGAASDMAGSGVVAKTRFCGIGADNVVTLA